MKLNFTVNETEEIINDWNCIAATVENSGMAHIYTRDELCTVYDVEDFGYSSKSKSFWAIAKPTCEEDGNFKQFKELLKNTRRDLCFADAPYFVVDTFGGVESLWSFKHANDMCSPVDFGTMADWLHSRYFASVEDRARMEIYEHIDQVSRIEDITELAKIN